MQSRRRLLLAEKWQQAGGAAAKAPGAAARPPAGGTPGLGAGREDAPPRPAPATSSGPAAAAAPRSHWCPAVTRASGPGLPGPRGGREGRGRGPGARLMKPGARVRPPSTLHSVGAGRCEPQVNCWAGREASRHPLTAAPAPAPRAPRLRPSGRPSSRACLSPSAD